MPRRPDMPRAATSRSRSPTRSSSSRPGSSIAERGGAAARGDHAGDRRRRRRRPTRGWCCSRASAPTAFASSPTTSRRRAASSTAPTRAAIVAYWRELDRSGPRARARSSGSSAADSDAYFATRPRDSQLGAWASPQSRPVADREELDRRLAEAERRFEGGRRPAAAALGRLPAAPADGRVLAGPGRPPARPLPLHAATATAGGSSGSARRRWPLDEVRAH